MSYNRDMPTGNCQKCINTFGTLGCCDTISNEWRYNCDDGMRYFDERKPQTNADRIRGMSDYDLAEWIANILTCHGAMSSSEEFDFDRYCIDCPLNKCCNDQPHDNIEDWLKAPVEVDK